MVSTRQIKQGAGPWPRKSPILPSPHQSRGSPQASASNALSAVSAVPTAGSVWVSQADIKRLAAFLDIPPGRFVRRFTRMVNGERILIDNAPSTDCVFLRDRTCTVYEGRPTQCRTYPWWLQNIQDEQSWREAADVCEGINHATAFFVPLAEIVEQVTLDQENEASPG